MQGDTVMQLYQLGMGPSYMVSLDGNMQLQEQKLNSFFLARSKENLKKRMKKRNYSASPKKRVRIQASFKETTTIKRRKKNKILTRVDTKFDKAVLNWELLERLTKFYKIKREENTSR